MQRLSILQLVPGMTVARNIITSNGEQLISKDTELTEKLITKLELYGIQTVYVDDKVLKEDSNKVAPRTPSCSEQIKQSKEFKLFKAEYDFQLEAFRDVLNGVVEKNMKLDVNELLRHSLEIAALGGGRANVLSMLQNMREYDDSTYAHCLNAALLCNIFATWLNFNRQEVELATACGLLHDLGKLMVPHSILAKPAGLTDNEYGEIQKHPIDGFQLLKEQNVDIHIQNAALMHHERTDGSGYPLHYRGSRIDKYARIVAIVDVYDAMTAARVYRGPICPFRVIEIFEKEGFQKYDVEYLLVFLENVVNTYVMNRCRLSDGREGDIIYINKYKLSRPVVQCGTEYVNLADETNLSIVALL